MRLPHFLAPLQGRPDIVALLAFAGLIMSGNGLVAPVLSIYGQVFSASSTLVGLIITLFGVGRLLTNLPAGLMAQRFGRKPVLLAGPALLIIGSVGAALAQDLSSLLAWRFLQGIGSGIYMTVSTIMLADIADDSDRGRLMSLYQAGLLLGAGIGPAIGGGMARAWGYAAPFWAYGAVCLAGLAVALLAVRETATSQPRRAASNVPATTGRFHSPAFAAICLSNFSVFFTRTAAQWVAIPLLAYEVHGLRIDVIGLILAMIATANFAMLPLSGSLIERYGATRASVASGGVVAVALALIALGPAPLFWTGLVVLGAGGGFIGPAVATRAAELAPRSTYGPAIGILRTSGDIGFVLGPLLLGALGDLFGVGHAAGILVNAALVLAAALWVALTASQTSGMPPADPHPHPMEP
jgi:DHA1 family multidrug resistance protein-like MFS transporter